MRVHSLQLTRFKRFASLSIDDLPATARLVVLAGPNGFGKSSLFEGFNLWSRRLNQRHWTDDPDYYDRPAVPVAAAGEGGSGPQLRMVKIVFHDGQPVAGTPAAKKAFYLRSAYRNDPDLAVSVFSKVAPAVDETRFNRLIDTDAAVTSNYQRLVSDAFEDAFDPDKVQMTLGNWGDRIVKDIREAMARLFPDLMLDNLGSPLRDPTFRFTKGEIGGFLYKNLSGGEKAAFDLLLDVVVKRRKYNDTVFCIDEPEAHLNPRVHGALLRELVNLMPASCQLWVATHAIGMMRALPGT